MATDTENKRGVCPTHGEVDGSRELPAVGFPFIVTKIQRTMAQRKTPFVCPQCGQPIKVG